MPRLKALVLLSLATLSVPLLAERTNPARPGTLNYIEGQASIDGQTLAAKSVGSSELQAGQTLVTGNGKAELLLTPGVFLRVDSNSTVRMVSPDLTRMEVSIDRGRAQVEVDQMYKQNVLLVNQGGAQTQMLKEGLYQFDAAAGTMRVFDGKALVFPTIDATKGVQVKGGKMFAFRGEPVKPQSFDRKASTTDELYRWSSLRSQYLGESNARLATQYAGNSRFHPGWFWDSGLYSYTWLPGNGLFLNPFGYGFYSPAYLYGGGMLYGYLGFGGYPGFGIGYGPGFGYGRGGFAGGYGYSGGFRSGGFTSRPSGSFVGGQGFHSGASAGGGSGSAGSGAGFTGGGGYHGGGRR